MKGNGKKEEKEKRSLKGKSTPKISILSLKSNLALCVCCVVYEFLKKLSDVV